jgi:tmRNA-binding protein
VAAQRPHPGVHRGHLDQPHARRIRKLLLHRKEIDRLAREVAEQGLTLIPLSLYFRDGNVKVELGLARGKRTYDKRQDLAKRDATREMDRA